MSTTRKNKFVLLAKINVYNDYNSYFFAYQHKSNQSNYQNL